MNKVNQEAIKKLLDTEDSVTISIYMPTHRYPTFEHINEDKIRFKNLLKSSREMLEKNGVDEGIIASTTIQLEDLVDKDEFWKHTTSGMAFFCSPGAFTYFHLPIESEEYVSVGDQYAIAPLLVAASFDRPYYLLALATKNPVLFYGDMYETERVDIELPVSIEKALNIDELFSNSRTDRAGNHGAGSKAHGQGDSRRAGQEERLKYFRIIDEKLSTSPLIDKSLPVLLAGTDDEVSGYSESSKLKTLMTSTLGGNLTETSNQELHARSWPVVQNELCSSEKADEIEKVYSLVGTGLASTENKDISVAADQGRARTLLLGMLEETRDSIGEANSAVTKITFSKNYTADKIDSLVRSVFNQGGRIVGILKSEMPRGVLEAAVYRY